MPSGLYNVSAFGDAKDAWGKDKSDQNGGIYLHELADPFESLYFQFVPQELTWQSQGNWVNISVPGRNNSYHQLTGGEDRLTFTLDFNSLFEQDPRMCVVKFSWLQSLRMLDGQRGSRRVKLIWGNSDLFRFKVWIVKSVSGRMSAFHSARNFDPTQLYVDVEMELDPDENTILSDVRLPDYIVQQPNSRRIQLGNGSNAPVA